MGDISWQQKKHTSSPLSTNALGCKHVYIPCGLSGMVETWPFQGSFDLQPRDHSRSLESPGIFDRIIISMISYRHLLTTCLHFCHVTNFHISLVYYPYQGLIRKTHGFPDPVVPRRYAPVLSVTRSLEARRWWRKPCSDPLEGQDPWFTGWWFQIFFIFTPIWGNDSQFDEHIFPRGGSTTN